MQSALLTNFKVLLALLFRDIVHQISKLIFYVTHISASFPTKGSNFTLNICLINFYSSSKNLNGNLGFAVAVNVLLSIKRFFLNKRNLYLSRAR